MFCGWWVLVWVGLCWFVDFVGFGGLLGVFYIAFMFSWCPGLLVACFDLRFLRVRVVG